MLREVFIVVSIFAFGVFAEENNITPQDSDSNDMSGSTLETVNRQLGTVIRINYSKGFGFISPSDGGRVVFFHISAINDDDFHSLIKGQGVSYEVGEGPKGIRAEKVLIIE